MSMCRVKITNSVINSSLSLTFVKVNANSTHSLHDDNLASYSYVTVSNSFNVYNIVVKTKIYIYRVLKKVDFT